MKAKDNIEEIILNNLKELNDFEPKEGHFERFQEKLNTQKKKRKITFNVVWKVAAAIIFVLLAVNQANIYFSSENENSFLTKNNSEFSLASVSPEYQEVEFYYTNAINVGLDQWNSLQADGFVSEEEQDLLDSELGEFEERFKTLQADLAANPNDERVINAMLEYYRTKLNIINMIVGKLEEVKQQKIKNQEISQDIPEV
jgi:hypothetical protein